MVALGTGSFTYEVEEGWGKLPDGWSFKECAVVGVDWTTRSLCWGSRPTTPLVSWTW